MADPVVEFGLPQRSGRFPRNSGDWREGLERRGDRLLGHELNVTTALRTAPELVGLLEYDDFALAVRFSGRQIAPWRAAASAGDKWLDEDTTGLKIWFQSVGLAVGQTNVVADSVALVARDRCVHPVRHYLKGLRWDGRPRLETWLTTYLAAAAGDGEQGTYLRVVGPKFLISAVARVMRPGCQVDHVLVLEGAQGIGKSRTVRTLAVRPEWSMDSLPDLHSKDSRILLAGRWFVELAELTALRRTDSTEAMKAFISAPTDKFRPPYGRAQVDVGRQNVFVATTNEGAYLRDPTGARRFWPVRCGAIDLVGLERDRDQLWAEALVQFERGAAWHLTDDQQTGLAGRQQRHRQQHTQVEEMVAAYLDTVPRPPENAHRETSVYDVLVHGLNLGADKPDFAERSQRLGPQVAAAMERAGWQKVSRTGYGTNRRTLYREVAAYQGNQGKQSHG